MVWNPLRMRLLKLLIDVRRMKKAIDAFNGRKNRGLHLGGHLILGLPGETKDDMLDHARKFLNYQ